MANLNLRKRLDSVTTDLAIIVKQTVTYSGVAKHDAKYVEMCAKLLEDYAKVLRDEARSAR